MQNKTKKLYFVVRRVYYNSVIYWPSRECAAGSVLDENDNELLPKLQLLLFYKDEGANVTKIQNKLECCLLESLPGGLAVNKSALFIMQ